MSDMSNSDDQKKAAADEGDAGSGVGAADAGRGNLDGTTASNASLEHSLDQAKGNGSFDDASDDRTDDTDEARTASDAGDSGQDAGSMS